MEGWQYLVACLAVVTILAVVGSWLDRRKEGGEQGRQVAKVYLNGIEIGCVPVAHHKAMLADARRSPLLYVRQAINTGLVTFNLLARVLRYMTATWMAMFLVATMAYPQALGEWLQGGVAGLAQANAAELGRGLQVWVICSFLFAGLALLIEFVTVAGPDWYGRRNVFAEEVNFQLRRELDASAQGKVQVLYWPVDTPGESLAQDAQA
ncbi:hypothetical protein [Aeromonas caviae]|uniref:hypothetical protein n=1 Tax=Aeromonas caviae TaxID=648 RepID=UPI0029D69BA9|nr:hypothetical protein [Aeromonas caviae]MDX7787725.1 hypothetical protein [Aeromonas caviae]